MIEFDYECNDLSVMHWLRQRADWVYFHVMNLSGHAYYAAIEMAISLSDLYRYH